MKSSINDLGSYLWMCPAIVGVDKVGPRCWLVYLKHDS